MENPQNSPVQSRRDQDPQFNLFSVKEMELDVFRLVRGVFRPSVKPFLNPINDEEDMFADSQGIFPEVRA
jgi:hypothetical protein